MKLSKKEPVSLFLKKTICFLGFFIKLYMFIKGERTVAAVPPLCNPSSSAFPREPFRWVPLRLTGGKASRRPPPIPPQPIQGAKPLENPPKRKLSVPRLMYGCRRKSTGPPSAAPARGVLRVMGTFLVRGIPRWMSTYERGVFHGCGTLYGYSSFSFSSAFFGSSG